MTAVRPGFQVTYNIYYKNEGTEIIDNGQIFLKFDKRLNFYSASPAIAFSNGETVEWAYSNLKPGDTRVISVSFDASAPPLLNISDALQSDVSIYPVSSDETPENNKAHITQQVTNSLDPNDKMESHNGKISPAEVSMGEYLNYTIRFQNMGNDTAFNIIVRDTLSDKLDWNTLQMITSSHPYLMNIKDGNKVTWEFSQILLPDDKVNEPGSHGFISYRIKPKNSVLLNDEIKNRASIYFDYNLPVMTDYVRTTVEELAPLPLHLTSFTGNYHDQKTTLRWTTVNEYDFDHFDIERSLDGRLFQKIGEKGTAGARDQVTQYFFEDNLRDVSGQNVYYRLGMVDVDGRRTFSNVIHVELSTHHNTAFVYPNPLRWSEASLSLEVNESYDVFMEVIDMLGNIAGGRI